MNKPAYIGLFFLLFIQACGQETNQKQSVNQNSLTEYPHEISKNYIGVNIRVSRVCPSGFITPI